jgi:hypothetical protein
MTPKTPSQLRKKAADLRTKGKLLTDAADRASRNAPGSYVTGGSGRSRVQNRATDRALERTISAAVEHGNFNREAEYLEARARSIENAPGRALAKERVKAAEKKARTAEVALPIINDPSATCHMTSTEWAKTNKDYKSVSVADVYRHREVVRGGRIQSVFLTDKPVMLLF